MNSTVGGDLISYAKSLCDDRLNAYRAAPHDAEEHANIETSVLAGGYAYRQIAELVQNGADAVSEAGDAGSGRIEIVIDDAGLWAANTGAPVDQSGVKALLNAHTSGKRAGQIGRFGLGFKSLLKLGGKIEVLSRSVCLTFNPEICRLRIRTILGLPTGAPTPGLRLAIAHSWADTLKHTPGLQRFSWATTVVFAELITSGAREAAIDEMSRFPSEFLLFLPGDVELVMRAKGFERHLKRSTTPDGFVTIEDLANEGRLQTWRVFETAVAITDEQAVADATNVHARDVIPLIWAAPVGQGRAEAGRFFAFFPTATETRTLGILNAPWKLNSDRTALIPGAWNAALMEAAAGLIVEKLPALMKETDPGIILDAFPRELVNLGEPAAPLVAALWKALLEKPVLPNCDGDLCNAMTLQRAPQDVPDLITEWSRLANSDACAAHLHPSCISTPHRIGRLNQFSERLATARKVPVLGRTVDARWLEMAASYDPEDAQKVILLAESYASAVAGYIWDSVRERVAIILADDGSLQLAMNITFGEPATEDMHRVHPFVAADPKVSAVLSRRFGISDDEGPDWSRLLRARVSQAHRDDHWEPVWDLLRKMPWQDIENEIGEHAVQVRTLEGWASPENCILPGAFLSAADLPTDGKKSEYLKAKLINLEYHNNDLAILRELGLSETLSWEWEPKYVSSQREEDIAEAWLQSWAAAGAMEHRAFLNNRPDLSLLRPTSFNMPDGWEFLICTEGATQSRIFQSMLISIASGLSAYCKPVTFRHTSRPTQWQSIEYPHPLWALSRSMFIRNERAAVACKNLLVPDAAARMKLVPSLAACADGVQAIQNASAGKISAGKSDIWKDVLPYLSHERVDPQTLVPLWEAAASDGVIPRKVCTPEGPVDLSEVLIASSERDALSAADAGFTCVALSPETTGKWLKYGARLFEKESQLSWTTLEGREEAVTILEVEPALREALAGRDNRGVLLVSNLLLRIGFVDRPVEWGLQDGQVIVDEMSFSKLSWPARVEILLTASRAAGWCKAGIELESLLTTGAAAKRRQVAEAPDLPSRLVAAIGDASVLLALFETDVQESLAGAPLVAADVALTLLGPAIFNEPSIRNALSANGLKPPERWGGEAASDFVMALGFPSEFATAPSRRRDPELLVGGPIELKPLHDYQETVVASLGALLVDKVQKRRRAVISLPTGAGKTRVAAETAMKQILCPVDGPDRFVLWVAQSDELCEQAVACFRELWSNLGNTGENLRIVRFWGGQTNPVGPVRGEPTVVVASVQTLTSRQSDKAVEWLSKPGLLVIDECHHALTASYTGLLKWMSTDEPQFREPPVIGLSATPFRGRNEDETEKLARRFDGRLIPADQGGLFEMLQERGVLANLDYQRLEMAGNFALSAEEEMHLTTFNKLPDTALERLGENKERNDLILDAIEAAKEKSVLLFATSVGHARRLAARLNVMGIKSAVVVGETDRNSRRWFISAFQRGDIRVLCNYAALTTGFDAPATDLIAIARPIFSPSMYMQMVGRGLRGPVNGGKDRCRILTVQDNFERFSDKLAHHYFEKYYLEQSSRNLGVDSILN